MDARVLLLLLALTPLAGQSGELRHAEVQYRNGVYFIHIDADIDADMSIVHAIVTDYDQLERLTMVLEDASLSDGPGPVEPRRLHLRARTCILIFCFRINAVSKLEEHGQEVINTTIIPELSDFKSGAISWQLLSRYKGASSMHIEGRVEPTFWIPPVIGPFLLRRKIIREAAEVIVRIETLAADG